MGLLDYLGEQQGGLLGGIGNFAGNNSNALIGLGAGIAGNATGGSWGEGIGKGLQGFAAGREKDAKLQTQQATYQYLIGQGVDPQQAQLIVANPDWMKEYGKAAISPGVTVGPDGSFVQQGPFGKLSVPGGFPVSERAPEVVNPDGSKSPGGYNVKPSLSNPTGYNVMPGGPPMGAPMVRPPMGPPPMPGVPAGAPMVGGPVPANDPTMTVSPRQVIPEPSRRVITEQSPQAISEDKATGEGLAKDYADIRTRGDAATKRIGTLARMQQLSPNAYEGAGAPAVQYARSLLTTFGVDAGKVPAGEEFTALANKMVIDANNGSLGPGVSNADVQYIAAQNPALSQTMEGRKQLIDTQVQIAKRDQQVAQMAYQWKQERRTMDGFSTALAAWAEKNPLFAGREPIAGFGDRFGASGGVGTQANGVRIIGVR